MLKIVSAFLLAIVSGQLNEERWGWPYRCENGKCFRGNFPISEQMIDVREHEFVCKMLCDPYGTLWPVPTISKPIFSKKLIWLKSTDMIQFYLKHKVPKEARSRAENILTNMVYILNDKISKRCYNPDEIIDTHRLRINARIFSNEVTLNWSINESYTLNVTTSESDNVATVNIDAETIFGVRHALESLYQTIAVYVVDKKCHLVMNDEIYIKDGPLYPHRGLLIDTSRHYLSMDTIKKIIDGMSHSKLNVLHWHATDSQSFPLKLPLVPELAKNGAYSMDEVYDADNIADIQEYGLFRGVQILMEIDAPAHAGYGWQTYDLPDGELFYGNVDEFANVSSSPVVCLNKIPYRSFCIQPPCGQLNPTNNKMYLNLINIYKDLKSILGEISAFHMGGDEVFIPCWRSSEDITTYMRNKGLGTSDDDFITLWSEFQNKSLELIDEVTGYQNISIILWSSHLTDPSFIQHRLNNTRYIIQTWVESTNPIPEQLIQKGYRIILSMTDAWYLDHGLWGKTQYHNWKVVYENRIPKNTSAVLGGEVCMWGEYVDDNTIQGVIWPRAAAFSERVWSNPDKGYTFAEERFVVHRERLVKLGIRAAPVNVQFCTQSTEYCH